ncbi:MAG TPA: LacI family DNA-binding transcriptional regulator [Armatimonadota bacterium]|jgi:DNA-binding LacI/PurR family transcriptional regulator
MSLREIADIAGVSVSTVSRVVNDKHRDKVSDETRARILEIARSLRYRPNPQAVSLKTGRPSNTLGVLIPYFSHVFRSFYWSEISSGVLDAAYSHGVGVNMMVYRDDSEETFRELLSTYRNVSGVILLAVNGHASPAVEQCRNGMLPCVAVNSNGADPNVHSVDCDNRAGGYNATRHLIKLGHTRIAHIGGRDFSDAHERLKGYRDALEEAGIPIDERLIVGGNFEETGGREAMRTLLSGSPRPSAVFAANDDSAIGAMSAAKRAGLRIPDDLAVVGFDDISVAQYVEPALTTVHQPIYRMGYRAAEMLIGRLQANEGRNGAAIARDIVHTRLVIRESCGGRRANGHEDMSIARPADPAPLSGEETPWKSQRL